jgi:hypothetical protein
MRHKRRFPRLKIDSAVKVTAQILHRVYNNLWVKRNPRLAGMNSFHGYDVAKTRMGRYASLHFLLLAQQLIEKKIEPTLYLKVMSKYGVYASLRYLPPTGFLASERALDIFEWLLKKEMRHHISLDGWKEHGLGSDKIDEKKILKGVDMSRKHVETVQEATGLELDDIVLTQQVFLSPWYLATCPSYLKHEVPSLPKEERWTIKRRVMYMLRNREFGKKVLAHARSHI